MIGIYLSGTGNTKHCIEKLLSLLDEKAEAVPIESRRAAEELERHDFIVLAYPVQFSNAPVMVREFIKERSALWKGKKVLCVATMGLFSGDGAGCSARLLKKYGANVVGGLHIHMPDSICDEKALKKSVEESRELIAAADRKIERTAERIKSGQYPREGIGFHYHLAGLFGQRLWFYGKTKDYAAGPKIGAECVGCGLCESLCPMGNLHVENGKAVGGGRCTMCYRCVASCPKKAITLLGRKVVCQRRFEDYVS